MHERKGNVGDVVIAESLVQRTARVLTTQASHCDALSSPLYAGLLRHAAEDLLVGGPTTDVLDGHLADPGRSALALRMLGGVHALVLTGRAPELAEFYPTAGGLADAGPGAALAWPVMRRVLAQHAADIRSWLDRPPQTNEVGRGAALAGAMCYLVAETAGPVRPVEVISRAGGDLSPVDPLSEEGRLRLGAYVWADQVARMDRLRGALDLAAQLPADLRAEPASATVAGISLVAGTWTVLWHSIMQQYLDAEQARQLAEGVAAVGATATESARFAHVTLELVRGTPQTPVEVTTWPGGRSAAGHRAAPRPPGHLERGQVTSGRGRRRRD